MGGLGKALGRVLVVLGYARRANGRCFALALGLALKQHSNRGQGL